MHLGKFPNFPSSAQLLTLSLLLTVFPSHFKQISCFCYGTAGWWDWQEVIGHSSPVHPNPDPPPIKATIKGYGVAAYRRESTNQEAAATSSAKISICKTVKLSGQPGQGSSGTSTHTPVSYSRAMHHIRLLLLGPRMEITGKNPMKVVTLSNCSHN